MVNISSEFVAEQLGTVSRAETGRSHASLNDGGTS